ncbi:type II toxin-antitoxin system RelE/ParE family toxin [Flavobacterium sp.]|uniref:type II toxin-antitoxin system RelE/ParE family toxin n=1 Tax=Flavobacterium sp. TaxID=239 RepID=UPI00286D3D64|nr:type II toxin-antitoxin system RelE/ParE family toxin [Flavobacterium sp.]
MAYNLTILPQAQEEIQKAFEYYEQLSVSVLTNFDLQLEDVYRNLEINPFYQVRYKHLRAIPFKSFPFLTFFDVDQDNNIIYIYSVFHTSQDPNKYPVR